MAIEQQYISAEKFAELVQQPRLADKLVELVEGELVEMPKPTGEHGEITFLLGLKIGNFVYEHHLGRMTAAETGFILERNPDGRDTIRGLDIAFISFEQAPEPLDRQFVPFAPDLAVEVISPGNSALDIHKKIRELLKAGTRLIWIVYPETQTVDIHTKSGAITLEIDDVLDGEDVLPNFKLLIRDIFPA